VSLVNNRAKHNLRYKKLLFSAIVAVALSANLYSSYASKAYNRLYHPAYQTLGSKVTDAHRMAFGTTATGLTLEEYNLLRELQPFEAAPPQATNITYVYAYDGFLADYLFELSYDVPASTPVKVMDVEEDRFEKTQRVDTLENHLRVHYSETLY